MEERNFMETKPLVPLLMSMSMPMMLSMLVQSLYNIIDSIYVSRLGTQALTAVSLAFPLQNIVLSVAVGVGVGISALLARSLGQKDQEQANGGCFMGSAFVCHSLCFVCHPRRCSDKAFFGAVYQKTRKFYAKRVTTPTLSCACRLAV